MYFSLLGPIQVRLEGGGELLLVRGSGRRVLFAALLLHANTVVPVDRLAGYLWGDDTPASVGASLHNQIHRLRQFLGDSGERVRAAAGGYLIEVRPGELDLVDFTERCAAGRLAVGGRRWDEAAAAYARALALWRGESAMVDLPNLGMHPSVQRLKEERLLALHGRIEADLNLARHQTLVPELRDLIVANPLREEFHGQLMLALYRDGHRVQALSAYVDCQRTLQAELGQEPSEALRDLYQRIRDGDPGLDLVRAAGPDTAASRPGTAASGRGTAASGRVTAARPGTDSVAAPAPAGARFQLPAATPAFTGRDRELDLLAAAAAAAPRGNDAGMVIVSAVDGVGGIGKTALAVRAAHRLSEGFPDGQLFVDLHGHTADLQPLRPEDALGQMLRSLGVPPKQVPGGLDERAAMYRAELSGTRTLILLDNAAGTAQVRPLLPDDPGCLVLITSRRQLAGLDDACFVSLDVLPEADAIALIRKVAGPGRIAPDDPHLGELARLCGYLPLALRIVASRLRHRSMMRVEDLVDRLLEEGGRLEVLRDEDRDLTAVFSSSLDSLPQAEQKLFRHLGLVPGTDFDGHAVANLLSIDLSAAQRLLESLLDHNLLVQTASGRYQMHDLVRAYARSLVGDAPEADRLALARLLDYYVAVAGRTDRHLSMRIRPVRKDGSSADRQSVLPELSDLDQARTWMRNELANILAAIGHPDVSPQYRVALTGALAGFLQYDAHWQQAQTLHRAAADLARGFGDRLEEANALWDLTRAQQMLNQIQDSIDTGERALAGYRSIGERLGEGNVLVDVSRSLTRRYDFQTATEYAQLAFARLDGLGLSVQLGLAAKQVGTAMMLAGDYPGSTQWLERTLEYLGPDDDRMARCEALFQLSRLKIMLGEYQSALALQREALVLSQVTGAKLGQANILCEMGLIAHYTGDYPAAIDLAGQALELFRELNMPLGQLYSFRVLARVNIAKRNFAEAREYAEQTLLLAGKTKSDREEANALQELGRSIHGLGEFQRAEELLRRSADLFRKVGDDQGLSEVCYSLGLAMIDSAGAAPALECHQEALDLARQVNSPLDEAHALDGLSQCHEQLGNSQDARANLVDAVAIYERIGAAEAEYAAQRLRTLQASDPA